MSNFIEYKDSIAFHPGYYIKELVDESGLTQEDFAKRLDTSPKNLSLLIRGEQSLSVDMAIKLSRLIGTSIEYWLGLQNTYDSLIAEFELQNEFEREKDILNKIGYKYFKDNFNFPDLKRKIEQQVEYVRKYLNISTLSVLNKYDFTVSFRSSRTNVRDKNIIKANTMVQIAINKALSVETPKFDKKKFDKAIDYALNFTNSHTEFYPYIYKAFHEAGVIFIILPNLEGSKINGATKKLGSKVVLMVNDRRLYADSFWFTLFHEIGHIVNDDYGLSFEDDYGEKEKIADDYAANRLIPPDMYEKFIADNEYFDLNIICDFAKKIGRDPGIILGRLQNDGKVRYDDINLVQLKRKYRIKIN